MVVLHSYATSRLTPWITILPDQSMVILTTSMDWFNMPSRRLTRAILAFRYYLGTLPLLRKRLTLKLREAKACQPPMSLSPRTVPSFRPPKPGVYPCHQGPQEMAKKRAKRLKANKQEAKKKKKLLRRLTSGCGATHHWPLLLQHYERCGAVACMLLLIPCGHSVRGVIGCIAVHLPVHFHCTSDFYFLLHCSFLTYSSIHFSHGTCLFTSNKLPEVNFWTCPTALRGNASLVSPGAMAGRRNAFVLGRMKHVLDLAC